MEFLVKNSNLVKQKADCLVVSIVADKKQSTLVQELDEQSNGLISQLIKSGDVSNELGKTTFLYPTSSPLKQKILLVGCGKTQYLDLTGSKKIIQAVIKELNNKKIKTLAWDILMLNSNISDDIAKQIPLLTYDAYYHFDLFKREKAPKCELTKLILLCRDMKTLKYAARNLKRGEIIAKAIQTTKTVANMPSNICNAEYLATQGKLLTKTYPSLKATCLGEKELARLNMNAYLAVGRGSPNESIMTILEYKGAKNKKDKPYVLVGKGLTFDSGGISIKPAGSMDEMKYDMCGAATVYGVMQAVAELALPINVVGIMAGCENMPDGNAYRPGDILTTMSGTTVEIINTDAEGRLVLCDVLTYVERYSPEAVIDIATLTGACIVALGHHYTGVMGNDNQLLADLVSSSNNADDKAWSLPIDNDFKAQIKSTCADIMNAAGRDGGTITAACFLAHFTQKYKWAHLDIAGTAWKSGANKGATGRPVAMLVEYLLSQSN